MIAKNIYIYDTFTLEFEIVSRFVYRQNVLPFADLLRSFDYVFELLSYKKVSGKL